MLFADVVQSMDIAAAVGAERLREIMADLADRCTAVVKRYGGTVDKFTGAYFMTDQPFTVQFELSGADLERLIVLGSDLEFLRDLPRDHLPSHTEVRLAAGVLRRLLVDGLLDAAWQRIGKSARVQPTVEATEIDSALTKWPTRWIFYAWAGGATSELAYHTGVILASIPEEDHEKYGSPEALLAAYPLPVTGERRQVTVKAWLDSTSVAIRTNEMGVVAISRRSVLKYIANRKGGVHFDPKRDLTMKTGKKRRAEVEHHLLDHGLLRVGHLSGPEYEVVSMAQAVASSDWAQQLIEIARNAAPDDFGGDPHELKYWTGLREADGTGWATSRFEYRPLSVLCQPTPWCSANRGGTLGYHARA